MSKLTDLLTKDAQAKVYPLSATLIELVSTKDDRLQREFDLATEDVLDAIWRFRRDYRLLMDMLDGPTDRDTDRAYGLEDDGPTISLIQRPFRDE